MRKKAKKVKGFVDRKIAWLAKTENEAYARSTLAKLRRGIGKPPGSLSELWEVTLKDLPEDLMGKGQDPSDCEWAVYSAMTLFALHQQGKDLNKECMSQKGESLGRSLRKLVGDEEEEKRIKRRFDATSTSTSMEEYSHHLRGLIQLLRAKSIPLDYPSLAEDLFWLQWPNARDSVRLRWGRDFYRLGKVKDSSEINSLRKEDEFDGSRNQE